MRKAQRDDGKVARDGGGPCICCSCRNSYFRRVALDLGRMHCFASHDSNPIDLSSVGYAHWLRVRQGIIWRSFPFVSVRGAPVFAHLPSLPSTTQRTCRTYAQYCAQSRRQMVKTSLISFSFPDVDVTLLCTRTLAKNFFYFSNIMVKLKYLIIIVLTLTVLYSWH